MSVVFVLLVIQDVLHVEPLLNAPFATLDSLMMAMVAVLIYPITLPIVLRDTTSILLATAHNAIQPAKPAQGQQFQTASLASQVHL